MFSLWSEWDIGHDNCVFTSKEKALAWLEKNDGVKEVLLEEGPDATIKDLFDQGLLGFEVVTVDP